MRKIILAFVVLVLLISILDFLNRGFNVFNKETKTSKSSQSTPITSTPIQSNEIITPTISAPIQNGYTILAAGDIGDCIHKKTAATGTAKLLDKYTGTILTLGDTTYPDGKKEEFITCFGPTWGKYKDRIFPSVGNHEYHTSGAKPYFDYFGKRAGEPGKGYYSFNLGNWHLVAVDTIILGREYLCPKYKNMCIGVKEQWEWLKKDLEQNKTDCTLVFGHYPLFSSVPTNETTQMTPLWELLYKEDVDVFLAGHAHDYERFAPQDPKGELDQKRGIREFVVGTGGTVLTDINSPLVKNSVVFNENKHGILKLVLGEGEYEWEFLSTDGSFVDRGKSVCH